RTRRHVHFQKARGVGRVCTGRVLLKIRQAVTIRVQGRIPTDRSSEILRLPIVREPVMVCVGQRGKGANHGGADRVGQVAEDDAVLGGASRRIRIDEGKKRRAFIGGGRCHRDRTTPPFPTVGQGVSRARSAEANEASFHHGLAQRR